MLHRHLAVRMVGQHGEDHEGSGTEGFFNHGIHGRQEELGNQQRPPHHGAVESEGRSRQERQVCFLIQLDQ